MPANEPEVSELPGETASSFCSSLEKELREASARHLAAALAERDHQHTSDREGLSKTVASLHQEVMSLQQAMTSQADEMERLRENEQAARKGRIEVDCHLKATI